MYSIVADAASTGGGAAVFGLIFLVGLYFVPTIVAAVRKVPNVGSVIVINIFLGWSIIGWVVALAMAARSAPVPHQVIVNQHPGYAPPPPPPPAS
jgi:hypothetical protein